MKPPPAMLEVVRELAHLGCVKVARTVEQRTGVCLTPKHVNELLDHVRGEASQQGSLPDEESGSASYTDERRTGLQIRLRLKHLQDLRRAGIAVDASLRAMFPWVGWEEKEN